MIKKIFIAPFFEKNIYGKIVYALNEEWFKYLKSLNLKFEILTPYNIEKIKTKNCAVILTGGGDLYKFKRRKENLLRDTFEKKVIKICKIKKIKILGVCRGMQLYSSINNCKFKKTKIHYHKNQEKINIIKNNYINEKSIHVNSFHKFKITKISKHFLNIGYAQDHSVEISMSSDQLFLGLMFHPERKNYDQKKIDKLIINWLLK
jgi:gamma-glutamyl-gamma-aminobutyrate hydrolase PuuD